MESGIYVGIDVSKSHLDVYAPALGAFRVEYTDDGLAELLERLSGHEIKLVVMEATGKLEAVCAATLSRSNIPVAVVNPRRVRDFARADGRLVSAGGRTWLPARSLECEAGVALGCSNSVALKESSGRPVVRARSPACKPATDRREVAGGCVESPAADR